MTWGTVSTTVNVEVLAGSPTAIVLSGCEGVVPAGTSCDVTHTVIDQYGNTMDAAFAGGLSWSTTNGITPSQRWRIPQIMSVRGRSASLPLLEQRFTDG